MIISPEWAFQDAATSPIVRLILLFRLFRLLRLLTRVKRFRVVAGTYARLLPAFSVLFGMQLATFYLYCAIGVLVFGGLIYKGNPLLEGTPYLASHYIPNNFNDFTAGLVTLFELSVVNNWPYVMSGFLAVTSWWSVIFFVSFWLVAVVITLNLVVAFILESFAFQFTEQKAEKDDVLLLDADDLDGTPEEVEDSTSIANDWDLAPQGQVDAELKAAAMRQKRLKELVAALGGQATVNQRVPLVVRRVRRNADIAYDLFLSS